ncbi:MAG: flavodoxin family protein [Lentisphaerae bacterium]|nr:flavodoxin family protein [Lentisphaerota bacterium]
MKVLLINGSPRKNGNTHLALSEVAKTLEAEGIETEIFWIGNKPVRGCTACCACVDKNLGKCVFDDDVCNKLSARFAEADGFVIGSPTYYGQPAGALLAVLQRVFFSAGAKVRGKVAASVAICRRGGSTAAFQCMNMPFEMLNSILIGSQYWNVAFGREPGEVTQDTEGMQTMRTLGKNMAWVLKNLHWDGAVPRSPQEEWQPMHFIR